MVIRNRKWSFINRKWNYFSPFRSSDQKTCFTKVSPFGLMIPRWFPENRKWKYLNRTTGCLWDCLFWGQQSHTMLQNRNILQKIECESQRYDCMVLNATQCNAMRLQCNATAMQCCAISMQCNAMQW